MLAAKLIRTPIQRQRIAQGKRAVSKFTPEIRAAIIAHPGSHKEAAAAHGVNYKAAWKIRTGRGLRRQAIDAHIPPTAKITIAPPMRDRFAPSADFDRPFSAAGVGRYL